MAKDVRQSRDSEADGPGRERSAEQEKGKGSLSSWLSKGNHKELALGAAAVLGIALYERHKTGGASSAPDAGAATPATTTDTSAADNSPDTWQLEQEIEALGSSVQDLENQMSNGSATTSSTSSSSSGVSPGGTMQRVPPNPSTTLVRVKNPAQLQELIHAGKPFYEARGPLHGIPKGTRKGTPMYAFESALDEVGPSLAEGPSSVASPPSLS